jgi:hypothetical protein
MVDTDWTLTPGTRVERKDLQAEYGGRTQGGIGPSRKTPNVLIFSDPVAGEPDGWDGDVFHYTGEGQRGDQQMKSGNAAILNHAEEGRDLRLFNGARGMVTYDGEFEVDEDQPFYLTDAPETGDGPLRQVIVFRLRPVDVGPKKASAMLASLVDAPLAEDVPIEEQQTERAYVAPSHEPYEAERREQKLVLKFEAFLRQRGHSVSRNKIRPPGEARPLFTDLYDATTKALFEAKGTVERNAIRMAIGQLADYRRFVDCGDPHHLVFLAPSKPRADLADLLESQGIALVYPVGTEFTDSLNGALLERSS